MIGVNNHLRSERYLGSMTILRRWLDSWGSYRLYIYGHFPKRYSKQKRINLTSECRWHVLHFLLVAGPQLNAVVLQGSARFAQGFDSSARQVPETGEQMILANQGQNRAQASRKLMRKLGLPEPPRAHAPPHVLFDFQHYSTLSYSSLLWAATFSFSSLSSDSSTSCTSSSKVQRASDIDRFWDIRRTAYLFVLMRHMHQVCIE